MTGNYKSQEPKRSPKMDRAIVDRSLTPNPAKTMADLTGKSITRQTSPGSPETLEQESRLQSSAKSLLKEVDDIFTQEEPSLEDFNRGFDIVEELKSLSQDRPTTRAIELIEAKLQRGRAELVLEDARALRIKGPNSIDDLETALESLENLDKQNVPSDIKQDIATVKRELLAMFKASCLESAKELFTILTCDSIPREEGLAILESAQAFSAFMKKNYSYSDLEKPLQSFAAALKEVKPQSGALLKELQALVKKDKISSDDLKRGFEIIKELKAKGNSDMSKEIDRIEGVLNEEKVQKALQKARKICLGNLPSKDKVARTLEAIASLDLRRIESTTQDYLMREKSRLKSFL